MVSTKNNILNYLIILGIILITIVIYILPVSYFDSALHESHCIHQQWLSKPCPGCGMTRAFYHATQFEFLKSITFNPSIILLLPTIFFEILFRFADAKWISQLRFLMYVLFCISLFVTYFIRLIF